VTGTRAVVLGLALAALLAPARARAQAIVAGLGGNPSALVGDSLDVPVVVDMTARSDRLGSFALRIQWNAAVLRFEAGLPGSFGEITANTDSAAQGVIRLAGANPAGVGGLVTLGIGRFVVLSADTTTLQLTFSQLYAAATYLNLLPSLTSAGGLFCAAQGRYGDINGDSVVDAFDAQIALTHSVGLSTPYDAVMSLGDVDGNGVVNARDALVMLSDAVGLDVSAFPRLGQILGGACATSATVTLALTPDTVGGVLVGQSVTFEARASGPGGGLVAVPNAVYRSSDTTVLAFAGGADPATALARAPGSVTVTAIRDGGDSARAAVTIVARRTTQYVDAKAAGATNQLGTSTFPFATIGAALAIARSGDTVRPQPGRYVESVVVDSDLVLLGDTLADGTRPVLSGGGGDNGVTLIDAGSAEVDNLELDGFDVGIDVEGPAHVLLRGIRMGNVAYGVLAGSGPIGQLRIESSRLVGTGTSADNGSGVELDATVDTVVIAGTEISDFTTDGVYASDADSIAVVGSRLHDLGESGVDVSTEGPVSFVMDSCAVLNTLNWSVSLGAIRSAAVSHTQLVNTPLGGAYGGYFTGIQVAGGGTGWVRIVADSIDLSGSGDPEWLDVESVDSLRLDSVWARLPNGYGYAASAPLVRVTNTQLVGLTGTALDVDPSGTPANTGVLAIDNLEIVGDPGCDLCADGIEAYSAAVTANRLTGVNLDEGVYAYGDSSLTISNSLFQHVEYPVEWSVSGGDSTSRLTVIGTTFDGFYEAVVSNYGGLRVDSSTFENGDEEGVDWGGYYPAQVTRSVFTNVPYAVDLSPYQPATAITDTVADNVITNPTSYGIYVDGDDSTSFALLRNTVTCAQASSGYPTGIELDYAGGTVASNAVSGCLYALEAYDDGSAPRTDSVLANALVVPHGGYEGIDVEGSIRSRIAGNTVTADTSTTALFGDIYVYGYQPGAIAVIDSNVVTGGVWEGIYAEDLDTLLVRYNTVRGVNAENANDGGIVTSGSLSYRALVYGNHVQGVVAGGGLVLDNADTAMVQVDSNLIDTVGVYGVWMSSGADSVVHNTIRGSGAVGVYVSGDVDVGRSVVDSNNIAGNAFGVYMTPIDGSLTALYDWWGDPNGPQYSGSEGAGVGDSVNNYVTYMPYATSAYGAGVAPAPIVRPPLVALRAGAAVRAPAAPAPTGRNAPVARAVRVARAAPAVPVKASGAGAAARPPVGSRPAQVASWQRAQQRRAAAAAAAGVRAQARAAREQARAATQQAAASRLQALKTQREARRQAKQARQAAALRTVLGRRARKP